MMHPFSFNESQFNRLFPFYILINTELQIIAIGKSVSKLLDLKNEKQFNQLFSIPRPFTPLQCFSDLVALENQLVVLESMTQKRILLRGQFELLEKTNEILFVGSPWFGSMEQVREKNLVIDDFAKHDPLIDLLHVMKSHEITTDDLKQLIATINKQKNELKKVNKEVHEIALFPTQNPDPLIRINFSGDVLRNNPSASLLDFFEFENETFRNDEFFKIVSERIDKTNPRWIIEARSSDRDYSFVCVPMPNEGYVNIYGRDITQQKKDQQKLERLSLVASANDNGVLFTTPDGYITWANEGFCALVGYTQEEIIGKSPIELCIGPQTDQATLQDVMQSFFRGEGFNTEIIYYRKDKTWFWGRSFSQPIKNNEGKITEFFGIIQDITEEKINAEKLKVLSQIAENNINPVVIADKNGSITWINKSFIELTGFTLQESIGKKPGKLLQGPETDKNTIDYLRKQIRLGEPFNAEIINYSKNGNKYWLRVAGQPLKNEKGELTGFFALEEDITKEKESENRFRKALENIGDNVWENDLRTGKTYFSKSENEFLGYTTNDSTSNKDFWWNSVLEEDRHLLIENEKKYRTGEIDSHNIEYRIRNNNGKISWVLDRGVVIEKDKKGKPLRITGTHTDITGQKTIEEELIKAKNAAESSKKIKESFLANMSHEIRTPMNAILGMGNQLAKTTLSEQQSFYLKTINSASENLLIIINDILDLSKIDAGKLNIEKIAFEPKIIVGNAMQVVLYKAEEKGIQLTNSFCDNRLAAVLIGDPYRLNQILLNLLSNAIKFTEKGTVDVTCEVIQETPDSQTIRASVSDTGVGMDAEFVERLFDKFSQEYESVSRKYGGTGLGMSICKDLIELMGGKIEVSSTKGKGTTISFNIEFEKGDEADIVPVEIENISTEFLKGKTILVTDDNDMNRLVASTILQNYGTIIIEAANGEEAVAAVKLGNIDLVLMDIQMPILNGFDASKMIREQNKNIPIIALTANAIKGETEKCIVAGMNDYIAKPFKEEELLRKISHWLLQMMPASTNVVKSTEQINSLLYDLSGLYEISRGNADFVKKMIKLFCDQAPVTVQQIKEAHQSGNIQSMSALAHKLKPSIDNLRIINLKHAIREIEKSGKEMIDKDLLKHHIQLTEEIVNMTVEQFKKEFSI